MPRFDFRPDLAGLGARLMGVMGLALLPLAVLTYVQTLDTKNVSESRARAAIMGETLLAAAPQIDVVLRAQGTVASLAALMPTLINDVENCKTALAGVKDDSDGAFSLVAYMQRNGRIDCASTGQTYDFPDNPFIARWLENPGPAVDVNREGPISNASIVAFSHPVRAPGGDVTGFVTISIPHSVIDRASMAQAGDKSTVDQPLSMITFDSKGEVLTSTLGLDAYADYLPRSRPLVDFVGTPGESFLDMTVGSGERAFAVVPVVPGRLYLMGSWSANRLNDTLIDGSLPAFTFPLLMWAASLLAAWLAAESQVLRHVRSLRDSITAFAGGNRTVRPLNFSSAATELREVGDAYEKMTESVLHDEADLENMVHQKEVLLREVHHRVKNNLQLIASILNMQLRTAKEPETRAAMRNVQERVISLATIHRELYQTTGLIDVRADELLPQIVDHILRIGSAPERQFTVKTNIDVIRLTPDQAVPLSLFLTEGMANVLKHSWRDGASKSRVELHLTREADGEGLFILRNRIEARDAEGGSDMPMESDGFGSQLLMAFARQLDGKVERSRRGGAYTLALRFPIRPLTDAEERSAVVAEEESAQS